MMSRQRLTIPLSAALLLAAAGSAYPWPSWVRNAIFAAGYYKNSRLTTLFSFSESDQKRGAYPIAGVTAAFGALIGTTSYPADASQASPPSGLSHNWSVQKLASLNYYTTTPLTAVTRDTVVGTEQNDVFVLTANETGVKKTIAYNFTGGIDGASPSDGLTIGPDGALYGAATGGAYNSGVVYRLAPTIQGGFTQSVIYTFTGGTDGSLPYGSLAFDSRGRLIGSTAAGGNLNCYGPYYYGCGVLFRLEPGGQGGKPWRYTLLHSFAGSTDGAGPGDITLDAQDNIFGATLSGGAGGAGAVYEAVARHRGDSVRYSVTTLWNFANGDDGGFPTTKLAIDASGALYGTARGGKMGAGTAFIVVPPIMPGGSWTFSVLHSFNGNDGADPIGALLLDKAGRLYGTTYDGGAHGAGTIFKLVP